MPFVAADVVVVAVVVAQMRKGPREPGRGRLRGVQ